MTTMFGFESRIDGRWSDTACGVQDRSNYLATREEAEAELPRLAEALGLDAADVRVVVREVWTVSREASTPNWQTVRVSYRGCTFAMAWNEANPQAVLYLDGRPTRYRTVDAEGRLDLAVQLLCTMKWGLCFRTREEAMAEGFKEADCTIWEDVGYEIVEDAHALLHTLVHA